MILMAIIPTMGEDQVRRHVLLQGLKCFLDLTPLEGEEPVPEGLHNHPMFEGSLQEQSTTRSRLAFPGLVAAEYDPHDVDRSTPREELEHASTTPNLDVVRMGPKAENGTWARQAWDQGEHGAAPLYGVRPRPMGLTSTFTGGSGGQSE